MHAQTGWPIVFLFPLPEQGQGWPRLQRGLAVMETRHSPLGASTGGELARSPSAARLTVCASSVKFSPACSTMKPSLKMGQ